ncbi:hypothetical protein [Xenorhabdus cabanillasii]|uniref:Uncharacterized protein n=1 Tax=Xenorhabdus cabanillasii JM26 TaxID=1427517 RepID=W1J9W6_9GAMM|nr:hypothetical protein [Xenorhabdus cabanillasii]PHM79140.1 hypothetical protein Xcab_00222 [Xenorhabdus cabanillasii JM26]CDL87532.1 conserved hypothetical protein [Xenorhabdus cabanillasii JM26]
MISSLSEQINQQSLKLNVDTPFLAVPASYNPNSGEIFTKVTATVRDTHGNPLPEVKIFVTNHSNGKLKEVIVFASNHEDKIVIELHDGYEGFFIETQDDGTLSFFIQPKESRGLILQLYAQIPGDENIVAADHEIYIVDHTYQELPDELLEPEIIGFSGGYLKSDGNSKFKAMINDIYDIINGAYILFFVNGKYTRMSIPFSEAGGFHLPYAIFGNKKSSDFSYVVIRETGDIYPYKSRPLTLTYMREPNEPWSEVDRIYDSCVVYSSAGISSENIIEHYTDVYNDTISYPNEDDAGLFVTIMGTNDPNDTSKVVFGSEVTLNLYINSRTGNFNWSCTKTMLSMSNRNTATLIFPIPRELLENKPAYYDRDGEIYFDYQVGTDLDPDVSYGKTWFAHINVLPE